MMRINILGRPPILIRQRMDLDLDVVMNMYTDMDINLF